MFYILIKIDVKFNKFGNYEAQFNNATYYYKAVLDL